MKGECHPRVGDTTIYYSEGLFVLYLVKLIVMTERVSGDFIRELGELRERCDIGWRGP